MALRVWLPMTKDLRNQGLDDVTVTNNGATVDNNGKLGKCYSFDGTSKYISLTNPLDDASEVSCSVWVKPSTNTSANEQIMNVGTSSGWTNIRFGILQRSVNQFIFHVSDGTNTINYNCISGTITVDEWIHIVCTYKEKTLKMYLNGELVKTYSISFIPSFSGISKIGLGAAPNGAEKFTGFITDFRLYDHALSPLEVKRLSQGLVLHYRLSEVGGENIFQKTDKVFDNNGARLSSTTVNNGLIIDSTAPNGKYRSWNLVAENGTNRGIYYTYTNSNITLDDLTANEIYTLSFWIRCSKSKNLIVSSLAESQTIQSYDDNTSAYNSNSNIILSSNWERHCVSFKWTSTSKVTTCFYLRSLDENVVLDIAAPKLEKGATATPWIPNPSDSTYSIMGLNDGIEYDCSGFGNNGVKVNTTIEIDTPRYTTSYGFIGSNSYVKTVDNNWISRPAEQITINMWAYKDDWTTYGGQRLFSCTEGAGFNTEALSGSISFHVNVYTNEARSSRGYTASDYRPLIPLSSLTSGWHMFTFIYTTQRIAAYVDGELVDNRDYVSYGAYCGDNIPLCIGAEATSNFNVAGGMFIGKISDFRMYYSELDDSSILALYNLGGSLDSNGTFHTYEYVEV